MENRIIWLLRAVPSQTLKLGSTASRTRHGSHSTHTLRALSKKDACHQSSMINCLFGHDRIRRLSMRQTQCLAREIGSWCALHSPITFQVTQLKRPMQTEDKFWVVVLARAPCTALLATGDEQPRHFRCFAGVSKLSCPLRTGHGMRAELVRDGVVVAQCHPQEFRFQAEPEVYNFNVYVAASE